MIESNGARRPPAASENRTRSSSLVPVVLFAAVMALAYGYEIFSFNVTIDEDSTATVDSWGRVHASLSEGRWAMAALSLLLPSPSIPAVSTGLGVGLSAIAWWVTARRYFELPPWATTVILAIAGTIPVLAFILSFSTVAFAIGVGNVLVLGFIAGMSSARWRYRFLGVASAAASIAVYDSFIIAIAAVALALIWMRPKLLMALITVTGTVVSLVLSRVIGEVATLVFRPEQSPYISNFFDLPGLLAHPRTRLTSAVSDVWSTLTLSADRFGLHSPWLAVAVAALAILALASVFVGRWSVAERAIRGAAVLGVLALPVAAEAVTTILVQRSMLFYPVIILVLGAMAFPAARFAYIKAPQALKPLAVVLVIAVTILTVLGNSTITNRLFSTSATTYSLDKQLGFEIGKEKERLFERSTEEVPTVIVGTHSWDQGEFTLVRETFGLSLFSFGEQRSLRFLHTHGVLVDSAEPELGSEIRELAKTLPAYPEPGWVSRHDGVLVINFERPSE